MKLKNRLLAVFLLTLILMGASCSSTASNKREEQGRLQELGQDFINDISNEYLPLKDAPSELAKKKIAVSTKNASYNTIYLQEFAESQQKGEDCSVTMAFSTTSTVISRVIFEDGKGYYLRYQYDEKKEGGELELTSKNYNKTQFILNDSRTKADLKIFLNKTEIATFTFRNITKHT